MGLESQGNCLQRNKAPKQKEKKGNDHLMTLLNSFKIFHYVLPGLSPKELV